FQQKAIDRLTDIVCQKKSALLIGATGVGKTTVLGYTLRNYITKFENEIKEKPFFPILYVTAPSILTQSTEDIFAKLGLPPSKVLMTTYSALRSTLGKVFLSWHKVGEREVWDA